MAVEHDESGREVYASLVGAPDGWYVGSEHTLWFVRASTFGLADDVGTVRSFRTRRDDRWAPYLRAPVVPGGFAGSHYREAKRIALLFRDELRLEAHDRATCDIEAARLASARDAASRRAGSRPRTVEVGMLLCRPADGVGASAWLVESVRPGVSATLSDCDHHDRHLPIAIAAIAHPDGGWVLAADWPAKTKGGE